MLGRCVPIFLLLGVANVLAKPTDDNSSILCGQRYNKSDWPWLAAIFRNSPHGLEFLCEGTLISRNLIVTAAHCLIEQNRKSLHTADIIVHLGRQNMAVWGENDISSVHNMRRMKSHPEFKLGSWTMDADIAVLTLVSDVAFTQNVHPVCMPKKDELVSEINQTAIVVGWDKKQLGERSHALKKLAHIYPESECKKLHFDPEEPEIVAHRTFCASFDKEKLSHDLFDSARQMYVNEKMEDGSQRWILKGILNAHIRRTSAYAFTNVSAFQDFIAIRELVDSYTLTSADVEAEEARILTEENCAKMLPLQTKKFSKKMEELDKEIEEFKYKLKDARELEDKAREDLKLTLSSKQVAILLYEIRGLLIKDGMAKEAGNVLLTSGLPEDAIKIVTETENFKQKYNDTAIFEAAEQNKLDVVKGLVYEGFNLKTTNKNGNTALHVAAINKRLSIYIWLAGRDKDVIDIENKHGKKASTLADEICGDNISIPYMITNQIADMDNDGVTLFQKAVHNASINTIKCLLKYSDVDPLDHDRNDYSSIHYAAKRGDTEIMRLVFINNSTVNKRDREGNTPLHYIAKNGNLEIAKLLIENGAKFNEKFINYDGNTPLQLAVTEGNPVAYYLFNLSQERNQSLNFVELSTGSSDKSDFVDQDFEGNTALHLAVKSGDVKLVERVLKFVPKAAFIVNNANDNPLDLARKEGEEEVITWLSDYMEQFNEYKE